MSSRMSMRARLKRFASAREGVAAVEFALVVGPFLFMIFAVLELAFVFLLSTSLDTATERAARRIRTGEVQTAGEGASAFKTTLCANMTWLASNCSTALKVDVRKFKQFADSNIPNPIKDCAARPPASASTTPPCCSTTAGRPTWWWSGPTISRRCSRPSSNRRSRA